MPHSEIGVMRGRARDHLADRLGQLDVLVVDIDLGDREDMTALERLLAGDVRPAVIVTSPNASVEAMRQLIRLGVADYLPQPITRDDVVGVIRSARARARMEPDR